MTTIAPPAEPVLDGYCLHCSGSGVVDDDGYEPGVGYVAREYKCDRCDGEGTAPYDADGRCCCPDCLTLPADQRFGGPQ